MKQAISGQETRGNYILNINHWESNTKMEGDNIILYKDLTTLFSMKVGGVNICVLCFKQHKINKLRFRKQSSYFFRARQCVNLAIVLIYFYDSKQSSGLFHRRWHCSRVHSIGFSISRTLRWCASEICLLLKGDNFPK